MPGPPPPGIGPVEFSAAATNSGSGSNPSRICRPTMEAWLFFDSSTKKCPGVTRDRRMTRGASSLTLKDVSLAHGVDLKQARL
jgi:hypothetical protein